MHVLWLSHFLLHPTTGYGALQRSRNLLQSVSRRHRVSLIAYYRRVDAELAPDLHAAGRALREFCEDVQILPHPLDGVDRAWRFARMWVTGAPFSVELYRSHALDRAVRSWLKSRQVDLVHADTLGLFERLLSDNSARIPAVLTHHNVESHMMRRRAERAPRGPKRLLLEEEARRLARYEQRYVPRYDANIVVSEIDRERLRQVVPNARIAVIENGVDCDYYTYAPRDPSSREIVFTGPLDWYPNVDAVRYFVDRVWPTVRRRVPDVRLTIIGRHAPPRLVADVAADQAIRFVGFVPDVRPYVRRARAAICPIRDGGGTRLKVLDALAQGIPMVSTPLGAEGLDLADGREILIGRTDAEFADHVVALLSDVELSNRIGRAGRAYVEERFSFDRIGARLAALYESLAEGRREAVGYATASSEGRDRSGYEPAVGPART